VTVGKLNLADKITDALLLLLLLYLTRVKIVDFWQRVNPRCAIQQLQLRADRSKHNNINNNILLCCD
jgi:hypothetical protein